ncbi:MAG: DEAD/DEAH box helicase, partial [Flavobacteriales bacterium]|nr:DEAD/DEAH box helicase [Flavobacteriales bacterium]
PTPIQQKVFQPVMSGKDIVGIAQTGTGKTLAFLLPILRGMKYSQQNHARVLIVVPTRELVIQIVERTEELTKYINCRVYGVYGGANINIQKQVIHDHGLDILVATPGRLADLVLSGILRLKDIKTLVIDEMDEMLNLGFRPQLLNILDMLPKRRQNLLFSATITDDVEYFINHFFDTPEKIEAAGAGTPVSLITQQVFEAPNFLSKAALLQHILQDENVFSKVLVFAGSRKFSDRLFEKLEPVFQEKIGVIHSNKSQNYRINSVQSFASGEYRILIATDLISRGIDIKNVSHVINFHMPDEVEHYVHRVGRTGRADRKGVAISFISEKDASIRADIESLIKKPLAILSVPEEVEFTSDLIEEERPKVMETHYLPKPKKVEEKGSAFHEKSEKNSKTNQGGSYRKEIKKKYKKRQTRGQKKRGKR